MHEQEALAIILSLEKLRSYLTHAKFKIRTDHRNLLWLLKQTIEKGKLARWGTIMSQWSIVPVTNPDLLEYDPGRILAYIKGPHNPGADWLPRMFDTEDGGSLPKRQFSDRVLAMNADSVETQKTNEHWCCLRRHESETVCVLLFKACFFQVAVRFEVWVNRPIF